MDVENCLKSVTHIMYERQSLLRDPYSTETDDHLDYLDRQIKRALGLAITAEEPEKKKLCECNDPLIRQFDDFNCSLCNLP